MDSLRQSNQFSYFGHFTELRKLFFSLSLDKISAYSSPLPKEPEKKLGESLSVSCKTSNSGVPHFTLNLNPAISTDR